MLKTSVCRKTIWLKTMNIKIMRSLRSRSRSIWFYLILIVPNLTTLAAASLDLDLAGGNSLDKTLIYGGDHTNGNIWYCEFAPAEDLQPPAYEKKCREKNPHMRMIKDGRVWFPWRRYTQGKEGEILKCPHRGANLSSCSNGDRIYSTCKVSCPEGYRNTSETIQCEIRGPLKNVSTEWSSTSYCEKLNIGESQQGGSGSRMIKLYWILPIIGVICLTIVIVIICVCKRRNKGSPLSTPQSASRSPLSTPQSASRPSLPEAETILSIESENPQDDSNNNRGISELYTGMHNRFHSDSFPSVHFACGGGDAEQLLNAAPEMTGKEWSSRRLQERKLSSCHDEAGSALLKEEDKENKKVKPACSCKALIKEFEELRQPDVEKLAGVLEFFEGRKRENTLYGYVFENWEDLGFQSKHCVELFQKNPAYRNGNKPFEYFLRHLMTCGIHISQILEYFHDRNALEAIGALLEFHHCDDCLQTFGSVSAH